jgi:hypothetical protein
MTKRAGRKRKSRRKRKKGRGKEIRRKSAIEKELPVVQAAAVARILSRLVGARGKRKLRRSIEEEREVVPAAAVVAAAAVVVAAPVHLLAGKREGKPERC